MEYNPLINEAWEWLMSHYGLDWIIYDYPIDFSFVSMQTAKKPRCQVMYYREGDPVLVKIRIIKDRNFWLTYKRKTVGLYAPCMEVDVRTAILFQLVHELTHFIEWLHGTDDGEVKPTFNELKYAYDEHYELYTNCKILTDNRRQHAKTQNFRCVNSQTA